MGNGARRQSQGIACLLITSLNVVMVVHGSTWRTVSAYAAGTTRLRPLAQEPAVADPNLDLLVVHHMTAVVRDLFGEPACVDDDCADDLNHSQLGRYAEFMVCAQLCKAGYYVVHVDAVGFDLVVSTDEGSYTVQVKSTSNSENGRCTWGISAHKEAGRGGRNEKRKARPIRRSDADLLALFHQQYGTTIIVPVQDRMGWTITLPAHQVQQASVEKSFASALALLVAEGGG